MSPMKLQRLASGESGATIWEPIWRTDPYSLPALRRARARRRLIEFGLQKFELSSDKQLLDLGCGSGEGLMLVADACSVGAKLCGIDISKSAVARALSLLKNRGTLCVGDVRNLPYRDGRFTHITAFGIIEHITEPEKLLSEVVRVAARRAKIFLTTSNSSSLLQVKNAALRAVGRYQYGYQCNWTEADFLKLVGCHLM